VAPTATSSGGTAATTPLRWVGQTTASSARRRGRDRRRAGNDTVFVRDGEADYVDCGSGKRDKVTYDRGLDIVLNCERKVPQ
jgi:hypothetical protein